MPKDGAQDFACPVIDLRKYGVWFAFRGGDDKLWSMNPRESISVDPDILGGTPVFKGTRVPVRTLFEYLADSLTLDYFLESFPSVSREVAVAVLRYSQEDLEQRVAA